MAISAVTAPVLITTNFVNYGRCFTITYLAAAVVDKSVQDVAGLSSNQHAY